jgi:hypothetical protein
MSKKEIITVQGTNITLLSQTDGRDYICITDIARYKNPLDPNGVLQNWMRNRSTIEFLGLWEQLNNADFNPLEFEGFRNASGSNAFTLAPQRWIEATNAVGMMSKSGRYGGTFAHQDIAFEFASWISPEFKLYLITEFKRLKTDEQHRFSAEWNLQRTLSKINYRIHTDAIKEQLIPKVVTKTQATTIYASEADLLNVALFGKTAAQWRSENPASKGNVRDAATLEQLVVLSNMESINALLIRQGLSPQDRLIQLNSVAITQMKSLLGNLNQTKRLK